MSTISPEHQATWLEVHATVLGRHGLHARPAIRFARAARSCRSRIQIRAEERSEWVDAKSVVKVMGLQIEHGRVIRLRATGADADVALSTLRKLLEGDLAADPEDGA